MQNYFSRHFGRSVKVYPTPKPLLCFSETSHNPVLYHMIKPPPILKHKWQQGGEKHRLLIKQSAQSY